MGISLPYTIDGFQTTPELGPGHYGFSITVEESIIRAFLSEKRDEESPLFKDLLNDLKNSVEEVDQSEVRIAYLGDTWLLSRIYAGGSCACFGIDGDDLSDIEDGNFSLIRYVPHNIDNSHQAATILSIWLSWFNCLASISEYD